MIDEIEASIKQGRGEIASGLLNNEILKEAFQNLHDEYIAAWKLTRANDTNAREKLWQAVQIVGKVRDHLRKVVDSGKLASRDLASIKYLKR